MKYLVKLKQGHTKRKMMCGRYMIDELIPRVIDFSKEEEELFKLEEIKHWFIIIPHVEDKKAKD